MSVCIFKPPELKVTCTEKEYMHELCLLSCSLWLCILLPINRITFVSQTDGKHYTHFCFTTWTTALLAQDVQPFQSGYLPLPCTNGHVPTKRPEEKEEMHHGSSKPLTLGVKQSQMGNCLYCFQSIVKVETCLESLGLRWIELNNYSSGNVVK